eukprot:3670470-Prymnesium_polylepis.1
MPARRPSGLERARSRTHGPPKQKPRPAMREPSTLGDAPSALIAASMRRRKSERSCLSAARAGTEKALSHPAPVASPYISTMRTVSPTAASASALQWRKRSCGPTAVWTRSTPGRRTAGSMPPPSAHTSRPYSGVPASLAYSTGSERTDSPRAKAAWISTSARHASRRTLALASSAATRGLLAVPPPISGSRSAAARAPPLLAVALARMS